MIVTTSRRKWLISSFFRLPSSLGMEGTVKWLWIHCKPPAGGGPVRVNLVSLPRRRESVEPFVIWLY